MEKIQQALQQLQRTLKSASADRHDEAAQLARDLYSLCLERGSDTELGKHIPTLSTVVYIKAILVPSSSIPTAVSFDSGHVCSLHDVSVVQQ